MPTPSTLAVLGNVVTLVSSSGSPGVWTTNCGTLWTNSPATAPYAGGSASSVYFKAQNKTSTGTVSCSGNGSTAATIQGVIPFPPNYSVSWQLDKRGVVSNTKRDGSRNGRILGSGTIMRDTTLQFRNRKKDDYTVMEQFVADHYPHLKFVYSDLLLNFNNLYQFAGPVKLTAEGPNRISFEVDVIQVE